MKKFMNILITCAIMFVMVNSITLVQKSYASKVWDQVGVNPTTTSRGVTLKAMKNLPNQAEMIEKVQTTFPDTVWVKFGSYLHEVSFGNASIMSDVWVMFDSTRALRWEHKGVCILEFVQCNNIAWTAPSKLVVSKVAATNPSDTGAVVSPTLPTESSWTWPLWFLNVLPILLSLLILCLLIFLIAAFLAYLFFPVRRIRQDNAAHQNPDDPNRPIQDEVERNRQARQALTDSDQRLNQHRERLQQQLNSLPPQPSAASDPAAGKSADPGNTAQ